MNANTARVEKADPQRVIRKAKSVEAISHPQSRRFYAKVLQGEVQRALAFNQAKTIQAVHDGEHYAFELGRIAEILNDIADQPDELER